MFMRSIKTKLSILAVLIILIVVCTITVPILLNSVQSETLLLREQADYMLKLTNAETSGFFTRIQTIISAGETFLEKGETDSQRIESFFNGLTKDNSDITLLYYATEVPYKDGGHFLSDLSWVPPVDFDQTTRLWFQGARNTTDFFLTDPFLDVNTGEMIISVSKQVNRNGRFLGVIAADVVVTKLIDVIHTLTLSENGNSYIVNQEGLYIANNDPDKVLNENFFTENDFVQYRNQFDEGQGFINLKVDNGKFLIGQKLTSTPNWIFVSTGPSAEIFESLYRSTRLIIILSVVATIVGIIASGLFSATIIKPLVRVKTSIANIASGDADLSQRIDGVSNDEIGALIEDFNKFVLKLQMIMKDVKDSKNELSKSGENLSEHAIDVATSINEIISNIQSISKQIGQQFNSVDKQVYAINKIASNITDLQNLISSQVDGVNQATSVVHKMVHDTYQVNDTVDKMAQAFMILEKNANDGILKHKAVDEQIRSIAQQSEMLHNANVAISNIASQTNLLAMNAAIEAAHAGDAGKGFGVVADEIRKLSATSSNQSKTIGEQLNIIRNSIAQIVKSSEDSNEAFSHVSGQITTTDNLVEQIKATMLEQQVGSKQITEVLTNMNNSSEQVKSRASEINYESKLIANEAQELHEFTKLMKSGIDEMSIGAQKINESGALLRDITSVVGESINKIENQIDQFKV
ncbi:MAG: methyl-accepting chemotaxis protein [Spirochaetaceae bacterium]|nr:methyl-accepting chemotaxis protein [Spirochaetaceae bacterium]